MPLSPFTLVPHHETREGQQERDDAQGKQIEPRFNFPGHAQAVINGLGTGCINGKFTIRQPFECLRDKVEVYGEHTVTTVSKFSITDTIGIPRDHDTLLFSPFLAS